jgi:hypothetical protein
MERLGLPSRGPPLASVRPLVNRRDAFNPAVMGLLLPSAHAS